MAQDLTGKRRNLISRAVAASEQFVAAYRDLEALSEEAPFAGTVTEDDLAGTELQHLTPQMVVDLFTVVIPAFRTTYNVTANKRLLNQLRR